VQRHRLIAGFLVVVAGCAVASAPGRVAARPNGLPACVGAGGLPAQTIAFKPAHAARVPGVVVGSGPDAVVVAGIPHGGLCTVARRQAALLAGLAANGFRTLLFESQAKGDSTAAMAEVHAASATLRRRGTRHLVLLGESLGGLLALSAAAKSDPAPTAVVSVSASASSLRSAHARSKLVDDARRSVQQLRAQLLFVAARSDRAALSTARALYRLAPARDKKLAIVPTSAAAASQVVRFVAESSRLPTSGTRGIALTQLGSSFGSAAGYSRYAYVAVDIANARAAGRLPVKSLVYVSGVSVRGNWGAIDTGVPLPQAQANGWLLKDASGKLVQNSRYGAYVGDIGSPAYQQAWVKNVQHFLAANGDDGVWIDDVIGDALQLTEGTYPAKYPNQSAWEDAQVSFVKYVGQALKAKGYYVLAQSISYVSGDQRSNTGELTASFWQRLAPYVNGLCSEYWVQLPTDPTVLRSSGSATWMQYWDGWTSLQNIVQNAGDDFFALMYGSSSATAVMRYGKASFLLNWDGAGGALIYGHPDGSDPWSPEWTADIGQPAGAKVQVGVGWRRNYTAGTVLLDPSPSSSQTFNLAASYVQPDGTQVTSVTLAPTTALVLRRAGS
jgi:pimeloyl-ACP methyl ester carboxylesterase